MCHGVLWFFVLTIRLEQIRTCTTQLMLITQQKEIEFWLYNFKVFVDC